ncbi:histone acetyltransferase TRA1 [Maudiozyma barnettii]|uniref:Similar to Saccharomyces cerevisiae YHR099W TRA1 Subunit of SAGA and NuA4 histone acetyltransferase complexes n=1 Tax=Maudiozyma barnettii TaxID=61262 RepID=A0A8H2ZHB8_9SACH|nr:histone acetyltransferase TRA1 [Kazachstania barnettii]CAB4253773.1 similar to Saccharomyces cerevisiae YHR099W TRA1 Subunit of SAGA and NuA4 histone acetyltransferase complexes [Kazachstania barnettii]
MSTVDSINLIETRLNEGNATLQAKYATLSELCDILDGGSREEYELFMSKIVPILLSNLNEIPISLNKSSTGHKLRYFILDILNRFLMAQAADEDVRKILDILLKILPEENEENGVLCMKILTVLFKSYKNILQEKVEQFITIIIQFYKNAPELVKNEFKSNETNDGVISDADTSDHNLLDPDVDEEKRESSKSKDEIQPNGISDDLDNNQVSKLRTTMFSFKILSECPITMVTLYSSYKNLTSSSLLEFTPLVMELLRTEVEQQKEARKKAEADGKRLTSVSSDIKNRITYSELILAQIKATSFLAYVFIRGYASDYLNENAELVPDLIVRLLQDCPSELSSARKELLHATRHILSTNYKSLFLKKLDYLFDEDVLIGHGFTTHEVLRPLAYSTVADFIHNIRSELQLYDIERTIKVYTGYLLDESLALTVQIMSAKLLLNLVERILKLGKEEPTDAPKAKKLLMVIIDAYTKRFKMLNRQYGSIMQHHRVYTKNKLEKVKVAQQSLKTEDINPDALMKDIFGDSTDKLMNTTEPNVETNSEILKVNQDKEDDTNMEIDENTVETSEIVLDIYNINEYYPILLAPVSNGDPIKDAFYLYRTLMSFLKTIIHDLKVFNPPHNDYTAAHAKLWTSVSRGFYYEEVLMFRELFHECVVGLKFFASTNEKSIVHPKKHFDIAMPSLPVSATKDGRELMDYLAFMFLQMDSSTFNEIIESEIDFIYERMLEDSALLHIAQSFLTNELTSPNFASIILRFLKSKLKDLGNVDFNESNILIRLFKLSFMSVNLFPNTNELVLLPHLNDLILDSLKYSTTTKEPLVYFYLIRTLFRSIGGGRFENLYRSIKPILQVLLQSLNEMIPTARYPHERELYVELCITVPVRLSVLAPYLPFLMKPLVFALQGHAELISQGLRTLELCIDNLTAEYFDPIIEPVIEDVTKALFKLLKPQPYNHTISHTTVKILSKLGGRNRRFLRAPHDLKEGNELDLEISALFKVNGLTEEIPLSVTPAIKTALDTLENYKSSVDYKRSAFNYISNVLLLFIKPSTDFPESYVSDIKEASRIYQIEKFKVPADYNTYPIVDRNMFSKQEELVVKLLEALFLATSIEELREEATTIINHVVDHFCLLQVNNTLLRKRYISNTFNIDIKLPNLSFNSNILVTAMSTALSCYMLPVREATINGIKRINERCMIIYEEKSVFQFSLLYDLMKQFMHDCYKEKFYEKEAGILGIKTLIEDTCVSTDVLKKLQPDLVAGFLFVLKDTPVGAPVTITKGAENLLNQVLVLTFDNVTEADLELKGIQHTLTDIVCELGNPHEKVRQICQSNLTVISEKTNIPIVKLMDKSKNFLLSPIFAKPLRALSFTMQIGNIDAVTYCLGLPDTFLTFNEELFRLLQEVIVLADAEDESLSTIQRATEYGTSEQLVKLRIACIKLLILALKNEEFATAQQGNIRIRILAVFFKTMLKTSPEIIDTTYEALKEALAENSRLPKELLQNGLKPMLMNLSDHQKLTESGLYALSKLLELLIAYFKVEIGKKLLDHLGAWCTFEVLDNIFGLDIINQTPTKIISSIINIFHLLPPRADMFLNDLMVKVLFLERKLRCHLDSPFRTPLAKYLNRFHSNVIEYFKRNLAPRQLTLFMCSIIKRTEAKDLAADFENEMLNFYNYYIENIPSNEVRVVSFFANMIDLFNTMIQIKGIEWLRDQEEMILKLQSMLTLTLELIKKRSFYIDGLQLSQAIEKYENIHLQYIKFHPEKTTLLFEFIQYTYTEDILLSHQIEDYVFSQIVKNEDTEYQNTSIQDALTFALDSSNLKTRIFLFKKVINASLIFDAVSNGSLDRLIGNNSSSKLIKYVATHVWKSSNENLFSNVAGELDGFRFELLQLSSIFMKWKPTALDEYKKDFIKFNWHFIKLEDTLLKQAAYLVTSFIIKEYDFPLNVVVQIFVALLRSPQTEARFLVSQSLDMLAPVIHKKTITTDTPNDWVSWVKRVMFENSSNQNSTLYQFVINHPDLFFKSRHLFISNIVHRMNKVTFMHNVNPDTQILSIDLASLILKWEEMDLVSHKKTSVDADGDIDMDNSTVAESVSTMVTPVTPRSSISLNLRETCISFLIRYICASDHRAIDNELGVRAINILSTLLSENYWSDVNVKLSYFEKYLSNVDSGAENTVYYCINTLDVLYIFFNNKPNEWVIENLTTIQSLLDKSIKSNHHDIQETLVKVLNSILKTIKEENTLSNSEEENPSSEFIKYLVSVINQDLQGASTIAAGVTLAWTLFVNFPERVDPLLNSLMKSFNKLCKDHLSTSQPKDAVTMEEAKITTKLLEKLLCLLSMKIASLGDTRRPFLSTIALLIDRSMDQRFLKKIVCLSRTWVFNNEVFPTIKEKAAILTKMLAFEVRGEPSLSTLVYEIVLELFENKQFNNTEITVRMEQPFLVGTKTQNIEIRRKFMKILEGSLEKDIKERLYYVIRDQNWEFIADYSWLNQALQLLYGAFDENHNLTLINTFEISSPKQLHEFLPEDTKPADLTIPNESDSKLIKFINEHTSALSKLCDVSAGDIFKPMVELFYEDPNAIQKAWVNIFPQIYKCIPRNEQYGFVRSLITLLSKPYHSRQMFNKPNVISVLLTSISDIDSLEIPPHLVKYLAMSYNSWYQSLKILESIQENNSIDNSKIIEANNDALLELYHNLQEDDMFYGLWRRRAKYNETNVALSYEQIGLWDKAEQLYEVAQVKARSGTLPYSESEYALWEDNWILCAEKLQQWDILTELAKHEGFTDLLLECGWRVADWKSDREALEQSVKSVMDIPTPRRQMFETFLALQNFADTGKGDQDIRRLCDEGIQLSLHKWVSLPDRYTNAHKWLLHGFQQYLEFLEATHVYTILHSTTAQNIDSKAQEVKRVFQAWRDRLPNIWDDIDLWNDLVTWRQHVFQVINNAYLPLIPSLQQNNNNNIINTHAYRGYHELAWIINRFSHVARKHDMPEVCISQLARIYTLPNIEIQEAFLKLREQAKCHYQNMNELTTGLDVISNTNLVYFGTGQKAEFFTLKGMFLSKLRAYDEANQAFATAVQIDLNLAKAWAQWGYFNDNRLSEEPNNISYASNALSCYLQAAGLYKNDKTRNLLCRILWLISIDDASNSLTNAFDSFRGEVPVWYWITFIPQLLTSLSHKEASMVRQILIRIAKSYPQALHFQLRTTREDFAVIQRRTMAVLGEKGEANNSQENAAQRQPWEHLQELSNILKTAYPLLALSLESLVAQINERFKTSPDEDLFRLINVLLIDGTFNYGRLPLPRANSQLPSSTETNLVRLSETLLDPHIRPKFNTDFIDSKPDFETYIKRLRYWRRRLENKLDRTPKVEYLERVCPNLSSFHHQKFEDIEIPGQYLLNHDSNVHFIKISKFLPAVDFVRSTLVSYRRINIRGHDGSIHSFAVQSPAARHSRREERMFQLYRLLNKLLDKHVQSKRRNLQFTLPIAIPLSPQVRIMNDKSSYVTLHQMYDEYCMKANINPDEIQQFVNDQLNIAHDKSLPPPDITLVKMEIFSSIHSMFLPTTVLKDSFCALYPEFEDFWLFRKQFTSSYGTVTFMTYMMMINNRTPSKIFVDKQSGDVFTLEMLPSRYPFERVKPLFKNLELNLPPDAPIFHNNEPVPFRLTPNIQKLIGDSALEGIFAVDIFTISRALLDPENELNSYLTLFIRDEIISWYSNMHRPIVENPQLREMIQSNVDLIIKRVSQLGHLSSTPTVTTQFVLDCISAAVNPRNLAGTNISYMAWF